MSRPKDDPSVLDLYPASVSSVSPKPKLYYFQTTYTIVPENISASYGMQHAQITAFSKLTAF